MKKIEEFAETLNKHSFFIITILLLLNLFSFIAADELKSFYNVLEQLLPDLIHNYLKNISINSKAIFNIYNLFLLFQISFLIYLFLSDYDIFYFPHEMKIKKMFEHSINISIGLMLIGNLLSRMGTLNVGIIDYYNYTLENHSFINYICLPMHGTNCLFLSLIIIGYFHD